MRPHRSSPLLNFSFLCIVKYLSFIVIALSLLLLAASCGSDKRVDDALQAADELIFVAPDSALIMLDSLNLTDASHAQRARHALLLTKAREKANIVISDDSLINIAVDYYRGCVTVSKCW